MCESLIKNSWRTNNNLVALLDFVPRGFRPQIHLVISTVKDCRTFDEVVGQDPSLLLHERNTAIVSGSARNSKQINLLARKQTILGALPSDRWMVSCSSVCLISRQAMSVLPLPVSSLLQTVSRVDS